MLGAKAQAPTPRSEQPFSCVFLTVPPQAGLSCLGGIWLAGAMIPPAFCGWDILPRQAMVSTPPPLNQVKVTRAGSLSPCSLALLRKATLYEHRVDSLLIRWCLCDHSCGQKANRKPEEESSGDKLRFSIFEPQSEVMSLAASRRHSVSCLAGESCKVAAETNAISFLAICPWPGVLGTTLLRPWSSCVSTTWAVTGIAESWVSHPTGRVTTYILGRLPGGPGRY